MTGVPAQIIVFGVVVIVTVGVAVALILTVYVNGVPGQLPAVDVGVMV